MLVLMSKIFISGGNGFIGSHLIDFLSDRGYEVRNFIRNKRKYEFSESVEDYFGDLTKLKDLEGAFENVDGVVHLGAFSTVIAGRKDPISCMETNIFGTMNVLESVKQMEERPWVILGSSCESDWNQTGVDKGEFKIPNSVYGLTKFVNELNGMIYSREYGMNVMALRIGYTYGSKRDNLDKAFSKLTKRAIDGEDLVLDSTKEFKFIHYKDLTKGISSAVDHMESLRNNVGYFNIFDLMPEETTTLEKLCKVLTGECGSESKIVLDYKEKDERNYNFVPGDSRKIFGFEIKKDFVEGVRDFYEEMKESENR
jgi:nucleoside-diphosphate-sugar epimerase